MNLKVILLQRKKSKKKNYFDPNTPKLQNKQYEQNRKNKISKILLQDLYIKGMKHFPLATSQMWRHGNKNNTCILRNHVCNFMLHFSFFKKLSTKIRLNTLGCDHFVTTYEVVYDPDSLFTLWDKSINHVVGGETSHTSD